MPCSILVIEDDREQSKPFIQMLKFKGYSVLHAYNGIDGMAKAIKSPPDLVIVDLLLVEKGDEMDGYDVIQALRETNETEGVGIIAWTSVFVDEKDQIRALLAGADDFVPKSLEFGVLEARIEALVRRLRREKP